MTKRIATAIALSLVAVATVASPASARWWGDGRWHDDDRWHHDYDRDHYYGYHYQPPPVVYSAPYNYGYAPPPVVYDAEPGVSFSLHIP